MTRMRSDVSLGAKWPTVELVGFYGGDETHALSAWTSTRRELDAERRKRLPALLRQLAEAGHHTPFEKSMLHFLIRCDTASHIHLLKHRIGVSVNAESARYKELREPAFHVPADWPDPLRQELAAWCSQAADVYRRVLAELEPVVGRARAKESARYFLPYANELTLDVSFNFRSFAHFVSLRDKPDAQREIAAIAGAMLDAVRATGAFNASLDGFGLNAPEEDA